MFSKLIFFQYSILLRFLYLWKNIFELLKKYIWVQYLNKLKADSNENSNTDLWVFNTSTHTYTCTNVHSHIRTHPLKIEINASLSCLIYNYVRNITGRCKRKIYFLCTNGLTGDYMTAAWLSLYVCSSFVMLRYRIDDKRRKKFENWF